ncbi:hypothetical protein GN958_ATG11811 [Phytophthora infestans]|uniref:Uncharacterized protein n=1 Tax=Phytophthora infestans TaxID=4787 RepID=A0A8S9UD21_PHYIN|nr:hypothetical protein GN958_ATG11811 [Phytophthora infestans]
MGMTHKCTILKKHLRPRALREQVETHQKLIDKSSAKNDVALYNLVREKALEQDAVHRSILRSQQHAKPDGKPSRHIEVRVAKKSDSDRTVAQTKPWTSKRKAQQDAGAARRSERPPITGFSNAVAKGKPRGGCFKCGKDHWLSECPDIDEVEKEEIMAKRAPKKQNAKRFRVKRVNPREKGNDRIRPTATLNAVLEAHYCADSGSDWNIISQKMMKELQALELYGCTSGIGSTSGAGSAAGPVRCQDQKRCLIVESDDDELIVGRVLWAELVIDVDRELEQLAAQNRDDDDSFGEPTGVPVRGVTQDADWQK